MFRSTSLVLVLFFTAGCGSAVVTCRTDSDCPPVDVCHSSTCVMLDPPRDAGSDGGSDAGVLLFVDAGLPQCTPRRCADVGALIAYMERLIATDASSDGVDVNTVTLVQDERLFGSV